MISIAPVSPFQLEEWASMRSELWPEEPRDELRCDAERFLAGKDKHTKAVLISCAMDGTATGFAELGIRSYAEGCLTDRVAYLEGWYVKPAWRNQGVGAALVAASEQWALANGCTEFASDALLENHVSRAAHLALGFEEVEVMRCFKKRLVQGEST